MKLYLISLLSLILIGCGQSGPLYLPADPVAPTPAPPAERSNSQ